MNDRGLVYLMYHELQVAGRALCENAGWYMRYVVNEADFQQQLAALRADGFRGLNVTQALDATPAGGPATVFTFDDGCETDLTIGAALLKQAGFSATFYVVADWVGRRGFLSPSQLRQLAELGFEIGSHSLTHAFLNNLGADRLRAELVDSKAKLEQWLGRRVDHFSCPGGRWSERAARAAQEAGYRSVATSRIGTNSHATDRFRLKRVAVLRGIALADFNRLCRGQGLLARRAQATVLSAAKRLLGNAIYQKVHTSLLGRDML